MPFYSLLHKKIITKTKPTRKQAMLAIVLNTPLNEMMLQCAQKTSIRSEQRLTAAYKNQPNNAIQLNNNPFTIHIYMSLEQ